MELSLGLAMLAMVLDTLSGKSPLYRLNTFFEEKDTEIVLGTDIESERFYDDNRCRSMDNIFEKSLSSVRKAAEYMVKLLSPTQAPTCLPMRR